MSETQEAENEQKALVEEEQHITPHHYPFQGTMQNIFQPKSGDDHESHCDQEHQSPIDHMIYHFEYKKWFMDQRDSWKHFDHDAAQAITNFKQEYIFGLGDMRLRSTCMFVSAGLFYMLISLRKPSMFGRVRNLGISFGLNGYLWVPELFNPMLIRKVNIPE